MTFRIHILPKPRIHRVSPVVAPPSGGVPITIYGLFFEQRSRVIRSTCPASLALTSACDVRGNATVALVNGTACLSTTVISDERLVCIVPPGTGLHDVSVSVYESVDATRTGVMPAGLAQGVVYYGGTVTGSRGGYIGAHVGGLSAEAALVSGEHGSASVVDNSVRAIAVLRGMMYIGGNFITSVGGHQVRYVAQLSGNGAATPLGNGLDGPVNTMTVYQNMLVIGGTFARVLDLTGTDRSGRGLATWDGSRWGTLGGDDFNGVVSSFLVNGSSLYVAGRFHDAGEALD